MTESTLQILAHFPTEAKRILKLSKKPTRMEYDDVAKITAIGIVILGTIGLVFILVKSLLSGIL